MPTPHEKPFHEWSLRVLDELVSLNKKTDAISVRTERLIEEFEHKLTALQVGVESRYLHIEQKLSVMNELLSGNGSPEKGLLVRVDRLEQAEERRTWVFRGFYAVWIGSAAAVIWKFFRGN